ncbi:hypothetical protein [Chitinophaga sp. HK235]|uniref:hypothetical protein n=1 Tax=Chitinophaga sp. HK235 TaxID=2952571 RepID=UPI001BAB2D39|nr:hypothetical protein [Chitinophaga sp. HK235]
MKIFCLSIVMFFFAVIIVNGQTLQNAFDSGNTISANNKFLFLNRSAPNSYFGLQWQTNGGNDFFLGLREVGDSNFHVYNYGTTADALTIRRSNSYIGIGTMNPQYNLQIQKTSLQPAIMIGGNYARSPRLQLFGLDIDPQAWMGLGTDMDNGPYEHSIYFPSANSGRLTFGDYNGTNYNVRMSILNNGNVGIGTTSPKSKLAVAGTITAHRVRVTINPADWPDFVFHENYSLPSLSELKKYLNINKHLPDIPSAKEAEKNGLDLGDMNKRLLQKVEELTLYIIKQQEDIIKQQKEIAELNTRLRKVENQ